MVLRRDAAPGYGDGAWEAGPRSAAELMEAAAHFDRAAALCLAPAVKAEKVRFADRLRKRTNAAEGM